MQRSNFVFNAIAMYLTDKKSELFQPLWSNQRLPISFPESALDRQPSIPLLSLEQFRELSP